MKDAASRRGELFGKLHSGPKKVAIAASVLGIVGLALAAGAVRNSRRRSLPSVQGRPKRRVQPHGDEPTTTLARTGVAVDERSTDSESRRDAAIGENPGTWSAPSIFDAVREVNAHAGRQATLLAFTIALTSLLGVGPLKPAVQAWNLDVYAVVYVLLGVMGVSTWYAAVNIYMALEPAVLEDINNEQAWHRLLFFKRRHSRFVSPAIAVAVTADVFATVWMIASDINIAMLVLLPLVLYLTAQSVLGLWKRQRFHRRFRRQHPDASRQDEVIAWLDFKLEDEHGVKLSSFESTPQPSS